MKKQVEVISKTDFIVRLSLSKAAWVLYRRYPQTCLSGRQAPPESRLFLRCLLVCFLATLLFFPTQAQKKDSLRAIYVERFPNYFFVWPIIKSRTSRFDIQSQSNSGEKLTYKPNNSVGMGFGMYVFEIGFELVFSVPIEEKKKTLFGESKASDLQLNVLGKNWGVDLFTQTYRGFYREDARRGIAVDQPFPQRPDIRTGNTGINGIYAFNKNRFSLRSSYNFSERQLKSSGSFLLTGTLNFFDLKADSAVYGSFYEAIFGANANFTEIGSTTFSVSPGYSYNLVLAKRLFINASLSIGPAQHWISYQTANGRISNQTLNSFVDLRLGIGYNSERFFAGTSYVQQSRNVKFEDIQFSSASSTYKLLIGYRFKEKGFLKWRAMDALSWVR
jgi:hypothetical protein